MATQRETYVKAIDFAIETLRLDARSSGTDASLRAEYLSTAEALSQLRAFIVGTTDDDIEVS